MEQKTIRTIEIGLLIAWLVLTLCIFIYYRDNVELMKTNPEQLIIDRYNANYCSCLDRDGELINFNGTTKWKYLNQLSNP